MGDFINVQSQERALAAPQRVNAQRQTCFCAFVCINSQHHPRVANNREHS